MTRKISRIFQSEVSRGFVAIARTGWVEKHLSSIFSSIAKTQFFFWIFFVLSTVSFQFSHSRSLVLSWSHFFFIALFPLVSAESKKKKKRKNPSNLQTCKPIYFSLCTCLKHLSPNLVQFLSNQLLWMKTVSSGLWNLKRLKPVMSQPSWSLLVVHNTNNDVNNHNKIVA